MNFNDIQENKRFKINEESCIFVKEFNNLPEFISENKINNENIYKKHI
jgi:hypothetical protein